MDYRRLPHTPRHRQARQGRPGRPAPAAPGRDGAQALAERNDLNTADVDDVILGTSSQRGGRAATSARMAALEAGYDIRSSGMTLDRFCGSGITSVNYRGRMSIMSGTEDLVIGGGTEMMSSTARKARLPMAFMDNGNLQLRACTRNRTRACAPMPSPRMEGITARHWMRSASSHSSAPTNAINNGYFDKSLIPVYPWTAHWRSTRKSSRARRPRWKAWPN